MTEAEVQPHTVAFMDFGTNSIRLLVIRVESNHSYTVLHRLKETVRLGEGEFTEDVLQPDAIDRAVAVATTFAQLARSSGADEIVAVGTAATREAENRNEFLHRLHEDSGVDLHVVSGLEEARLIYLGVSSSVNIGDRLAFFIDIGGGSTETSVGTQSDYLYLNSLKMGAIRLTNQFLASHERPIQKATYERIRGYVRNHGARTLTELSAFASGLAIGSSGTIENLADVCIRLSRKRPRLPDDIMTYAELKEGIRLLCSLPIEERRRVPGLNPTRADIIIGGAAIIDTFMEALEIPDIRISDQGLREGLVVDYMRRHDHIDLVNGVPLRRRNILQLARKCRFNDDHAYTTERLALRLFDTVKAIGLHNLGEWEREMLEYAALLHHVGSFLTYSGYQRHGYYIVRNADLLGFDDLEIETIALTVLHHRGTPIRKRAPELEALTNKQKDTIEILSTLLRLAEVLDRSQTGNIEDASLRRISPTEVVLDLQGARDFRVELSGLDNQRDVFERVFRLKLRVNPLPDDETRIASA